MMGDTNRHVELTLKFRYPDGPDAFQRWTGIATEAWKTGETREAEIEQCVAQLVRTMTRDLAQMLKDAK